MTEQALPSNYLVRFKKYWVVLSSPSRNCLRRKNKMVCWSVYRKVNVGALAIGSTLDSLTISKTTKQKDSVNNKRREKTTG